MLTDAGAARAMVAFEGLGEAGTPWFRGMRREPLR